jgi:hypothetical protein
MLCKKRLSFVENFGGIIGICVTQNLNTMILYQVILHLFSPGYLGPSLIHLVNGGHLLY